MSGTTVAAAKAYVFTHAGTSINDSAVVVAYDQPLALEDDLVVVGTASGPIKIAATRGTVQLVLQEEYVVEVIVDVYRGGDDFRTTFERACALVDLVIAPVRSDPTLGGAVAWCAPSEVTYDPAWVDDKKDNHMGTRCKATVRLACTARI